MERKSVETKIILKRRQLLQWGLLGGGTIGVGALLNHLAFSSSTSAVQVPPIPADLPSFGSSISPMQVLRQFDYGTLKSENGKMIREFEAVANSTELQLNSATPFVSWNINGRVPGPTFRAKAGDRVRILFHNQDGHSHTLHFHGTHPTEMDGIKPVRHGKTTVYEFDAQPYGVHLYHCHIAPVTRHVGKGLYGMFIIDPPQGRPPADELVLVMGGYDLNNDQHNELYAFNGIPNYYRDYPIPIAQNQLVRLYLLNMIEFDPALTFHIHANFFQVYRTGRYPRVSLCGSRALYVSSSPGRNC
jgi:manganese oxidase